ncbi:LytR C-terminal domain-containing protein [Umezawaea beigongshangensis]|uniref:LytR C-terminal domain-containing protein n=1 Tax=Umezawaea beigongshangensis TaxID=2780383 RepID=UPI0018F235C3|nr:LytR C-terminal domain-containing protein [Umezawaea beigongshangensis]
MSSPDSAGSARPAKTAGIALIAVAVVALVIGVLSLVDGGDSGDPLAGGPPADPPSTSAPGGDQGGGGSDEPAPSTTQAPESSTAASTTSEQSPTTQPPTEQPPATTSQPAAGQPTAAETDGNAAERPPVRVYNNSTVAGLASRASEDVRTNGWTVAETGNYSQGQIPTTTVYYRPGTPEEASAKTLAAIIRARVEPRFDGIQAAHEGIIVIVTNDYGTKAATK